jgi:hypothetical protein
MPTSIHTINEGERSAGLFASSLADRLGSGPPMVLVGGKTKNRMSPSQGKNVAMEDLKVADPIVGGLKPMEQSEAGGFSRPGLSKSSPSYDGINHVDAEIRGSVQERAEGDIQFAELRQTIKRDRENSQGTTPRRFF